jgi:hypothetical protein
MPQLSAPVKAVRLAATLRPKAKSLTSMPSLYDSIVAASKAIKYGVPAVGVGGLALFAKSSAETKEAAFQVLEKSAAFEKEALSPLKLVGGIAKAPKLLSRLFTKARKPTVPLKYALPKGSDIVRKGPAGVAPTAVMPKIKPNKVPGFTPTTADLEAAKAVSIAAPTRFQNAVDGFRAGWGNRAGVMPTTPVGGVFDRAHTAGKHIYNNRGTYGVAAGVGGMGVVDHSIDAARKRALENMSPLQRMQAAGAMLFSPKSLTNKIW